MTVEISFPFDVRRVRFIGRNPPVGAVREPPTIRASPTQRARRTHDTIPRNNTRALSWATEIHVGPRVVGMVTPGIPMACNRIGRGRFTNRPYEISISVDWGFCKSANGVSHIGGETRTHHIERTRGNKPRIALHP